jgi:hypothetical protein
MSCNQGEPPWRGTAITLWGALQSIGQQVDADASPVECSEAVPGVRTRRGVLWASSAIPTRPSWSRCQPGAQDVWAHLMRTDPYALESQSPSWTGAMCGTNGFEDVSRLYETADGRVLVLPLLRRTMISLDRLNWRVRPAGTTITRGIPDGRFRCRHSRSASGTNRMYTRSTDSNGYHISDRTRDLNLIKLLIIFRGQLPESPILSPPDITWQVRRIRAEQTMVVWR